MNWKIDFFNDSVEEAILAMPQKIQARMLKLLELIEKHGANLDPPQREGILLFCMRLLKKHRKPLSKILV